MSKRAAAGARGRPRSWLAASGAIRASPTARMRTWVSRRPSGRSNRSDRLGALVPAPPRFGAGEVHAADPAVDAVERDVVLGTVQHPGAGGGQAQPGM